MAYYAVVGLDMLATALVNNLTQSGSGYTSDGIWMKSVFSGVKFEDDDDL